MANMLRNLKIGEVSFCVKGMNPHAKVALFKSSDPEPDDVTIAKATFQEALAGQMLSHEVSEIFYRAFDNQYKMNNAFKTALVDELVAGGDGSAAGTDYVAAISMMAASAVNAARTIGAKATETELEAAVEKAVAEYVSTKQETTMTKITNKAALLAAVAKFDPAKTTMAEVAEIQKAATEFDCVAELPVALAPPSENSELAKLKADLAKRDAIDGMSADVRKHYDGLDAAAKTAFLAKTSDERNAAVAELNKADPILYTTTGGIEVRKSDGAVTLALAKQADADKATIAALTKSNDEVSLEKAVAEFPNVAKGVATTMLKSVATGTDAEKQEVREALTAMNKANAGLFKRVGTGHSGTQQPTGDTFAKSDAEAELHKMAEELAASKGITFEKALLDVSMSPGGAALYAQAYPATAN